MKTGNPQTTRTKIPERIRTIFWNVADGSRKYENCNAPPLGDLISGKAQINNASVAHIVAAETDGPPGDPICARASAKSVETGDGAVGLTIVPPGMYSPTSLAR